MNQHQADHYPLAAFAIAISTIVMGAVTTLVPGTATPHVSAAPAAAADVPFVYFPAQHANQATQIEPMPPTF